MTQQKMQGIILKGIGGFYYVETADGVFECRAKGSFRKDKISPLAGDKVVISVNENMENIIDKIMERKNFFIRPPIANLDTLIIVVSMADPAPNLCIIDNLIAIATHKDVECVLVFNKTDLKSADEIAANYIKAGFKVIVNNFNDNISAIYEIKAVINGKVCAFTGNSGVGKSTILNSIDALLGLQTAQTSKKLGRGKHTTRQVELYKTALGYVADTPGFSSLDFEKCERITKDELQYCFREFEPYIDKCKFTHCAHVCDKGCAVIEAVERGDIVKSRFESYKMLYAQVKDYKEWENK